MDYPKSLPGAGLVNGKFVDENPLTGAIGSLIPAQWGNAVTEEVLNVIQSAGLAADEQDNAQLKSAIEQKITQSVLPVASVQDAEQGTDNVKRMTPLRVFQAIAKRVVQASESIAGVAKIATQVQTDSGADTTTIVTPKTPALAFLPV